MSDEADRTIPATPRRREAARHEGLMPTAAPLAGAAASLTAVLLLPAWARATFPAAQELLRRSLAPTDILPGPGDVAPVGLLLPAVGLVLAAALAGITVRIVCDGFAWEPARLAPRLSRLDPVSGVARILSARTLLTALGSGLGLVVLVATALTAATPSIGATATGRLDGDPTRAALAAWWTLVCLATAALLVGLVQYAIARLGFERRIRMTPQEFADELRSLQSDKKVRPHGSPGRHRPRAMHDGRPTPQPETGGS